MAERVQKLLDRIVKKFFPGYVRGYMHRNIYDAIKAIRRYNDVHAVFSNVARWPSDVKSFENLSFLFPSSQANFGLCLLAFDEASYLYSIAKKIHKGRLAEIGRFKGGGTFLIAAAMSDGATLDSFDIHLISSVYNDGEPHPVDGAELDRDLGKALARFGLGARVKLFVKDSTKVNPASASYDFIFIDGDHTYEGVKSDFLHWKDALKNGGHLLFHDAADTRPFSSFHRDLLKLMDEIERDYVSQFKKVGAVGTLVHFQKTG